ncbi:MAG: hypothetical protein QOJ50_3986 [Cryptosporangiaceae bacterium]|nr:hypothetical protein [Cryptosporangiaceae bacterium]
MSSRPHPHPLFDGAPGQSKGAHRDPSDWHGLPISDEERRRLAYLTDNRYKLIEDNNHVFQPQLMVRTYVGDRGVRPYAGHGYESPDIWVALGDPSQTPAIPSHPGGNAVAGKPHTLYAHVWNLGLAPVVGIAVEFLVFNPSIAFDGQTPLFRGIARLELGSVTVPNEAHRLVKCQTPWVPSVVNGGHECIIVRVACLADGLDPHQFNPHVERKVAQRNMHVALYGSNQSALLASLTKTLPKNAQLKLFVMGPEAQNQVDLTAPGLKINPAVKTAPIEDLKYAPKPKPGEATVVRIVGVDPRQAAPVGGYTLVLTAQPLDKPLTPSPHTPR